MSALIKSGEAVTVRALAPVEPVSAAPVAAPVADAGEIERAALHAEIDRLSAALAVLRDGMDADVLEAHRKGRAEGLAEAEAREEDRVALLREGIEAANAAFAERLEALDRLAPQLVRAALAKLFDTPGEWGAMAEAMVARQLGILRRANVIALHVSAEDFADAAALEAVVGDLRVERDRSLRSGACRIECTLGQVDLDARTHWAALGALLDEMSEPA